MELLKLESLAYVLKMVPKTPLLLHSSLTRPFAESFKVEPLAFEKRLGFPAPLALAVRRNYEGVRSEADLSFFDRVALDWLEEFTGWRDRQGPSIALTVGGFQSCTCRW